MRIAAGIVSRSPSALLAHILLNVIPDDDPSQTGIAMKIQNACRTALISASVILGCTAHAADWSDTQGDCMSPHS
jgi:hypothetical protein